MFWPHWLRTHAWFCLRAVLGEVVHSPAYLFYTLPYPGFALRQALLQTSEACRNLPEPGVVRATCGGDSRAEALCRRTHSLGPHDG
jgi:hypothetical protein